MTENVNDKSFGKGLGREVLSVYNQKIICIDRSRIAEGYLGSRTFCFRSTITSVSGSFVERSSALGRSLNKFKNERKLSCRNRERESVYL